MYIYVCVYVCVCVSVLRNAMHHRLHVVSIVLASLQDRREDGERFRLLGTRVLRSTFQSSVMSLIEKYS